MKRTLLFLFGLIILSGCEKDPPVDPPRPADTEQTLFMYMPWSGNLTSYFEQNLRDFETAIKTGILDNNRVVVFFCSSPTDATLFEIKYDNGTVSRQTFKTYSNPAFTTAEGITSIMNDMRAAAPAKRYAMIVGSHGMGWLPVPSAASRSAGDRGKFHWEYDGVPMTRFFGGLKPEHQTDVTTFARGIADAGLKMEYILFDDCYMAGIEVAYDLKEVTKRLIASPTEVMAYGYPYHLIGESLINNDYAGICNGFYEFYEQYQYPYGTIGLIDCSEVEALAAVMREINRRFTFDQTRLGSVQRMDGYSPVIFFDYGDYVAKLCTDAELSARFEAQLKRTAPPQYALHTRSYYSMSRGPVEIGGYSGITISDPSVNSRAAAKTETAWYTATH